MDIRNNLDTAFFRNKKLAIASSCDLQELYYLLRERNLFREISYNFIQGTSDDASLEIMRPDTPLKDADVIILSIAETTKKLVYPVVFGRRVDHKLVFENIKTQLNAVVEASSGYRAEAIFLFPYPINPWLSPLYDESMGLNSLRLWKRRIDALYDEVVERYFPRVQILSLDEALTFTGWGRKFFRQEVEGGHPEKFGAFNLMTLFLERYSGLCNKSSKIKAIVFDLDNTLWNGVLAESIGYPDLFRERVYSAFKHGENGIPLAVISKNEHSDTERVKCHFEKEAPGFAKYCVAWDLSWAQKSERVKRLADLLGIAADSIAFFDDSNFERDEVLHSFETIRCYTEHEIIPSLRYSEFSFSSLSEDAKTRVEKYKTNIERQKFDDDYRGMDARSESYEAYLKTLEFHIRFDYATREQITRLEELTVRTNQQNLLLNRSPAAVIREYIERERAVVVSLSDRFGDYGTIGVIMYDYEVKVVRLKELAISCRALGKGVERSILSYLCNKFAGADSIQFSYTLTDRNRSFFDLVSSFGFEDYGGYLALSPSESSSYPEWFKVSDMTKEFDNNVEST